MQEQIIVYEYTHEVQGETYADFQLDAGKCMRTMFAPNLIEAENSALVCAHLPKALEELLGGRDEARVPDNGLENDSRNFSLVGVEDGLD
jgi:hypothetical protein